MFNVCWLDKSTGVMTPQVKQFHDHDIATSWAVTSLSRKDIKWLIRDTTANKVYLGDTTELALQKLAETVDKYCK